jgi:DNA-binding GntR family transcriptional regulator
MSGAPAPPLYAQIAARLRSQIAAGEYPAGSRVPSEHELAERHGVGRPTVRQATELLVREQVLERRRGSGTYVSALPRTVDLFSAGGTLASFAKSGLQVSVRMLGRVRRRDVAGEPASLAGRQVFFLARRSSVGEIPVLLEELYFDAAFFPGLDQLSLAGRSLSELTRERYSLQPRAVEQRFSVAALEGERADTLGVSGGEAVLRVERTIDFVGAPQALHAVLWCRTDTVHFSQTLAFDSVGAALVRDVPPASPGTS